MFKDKVVVITGAASGIGRAIAEQYIMEQAKVVLVDINLKQLEQTKKELEKNSEVGVSVIVSDVSVEEDVKKYVNEVVEKFGKIDIFINNAGIEGTVKNIDEYPVDVFDKVNKVNVYGAFNGLKYVLSMMKKSKSGTIVNTASIGGLKGMPGTGPYNASKFALIGLTKTAALEYAKHNIRVNAVCPAPTNTRLMKSFEKSSDFDLKKHLESSIPMGRYGEPKEIADAVLFLSSEKASYITGVVLPVDGGMTAQ